MPYQSHGRPVITNLALQSVPYRRRRGSPVTLGTLRASTFRLGTRSGQLSRESPLKDKHPRRTEGYEQAWQRRKAAQ